MYIHSPVVTFNHKYVLQSFIDGAHSIIKFKMFSLNLYDIYEQPYALHFTTYIYKLRQTDAEV